MATQSTQWKAVALPREHGGWVMLAEAVIVGMALRPTVAGVLLAALGVLVFFARQPWRIYIRDRQAGKSYPRTRLARDVGMLYAVNGAALGAFLFFWIRTPFWVPLVIALPLLGVSVMFSLQQRDKELMPELCGAMASGGIGAAILVAGEQPLVVALTVWLALAVRAVTSVMYVRQRLQAVRGRVVHSRTVVGVHATGMLVLLGGAVGGWMPWPVVVAFSFLCIRTVHGLSPGRSRQRPQIIGMQEVLIGLANGVAIIIGFV